MGTLVGTAATRLFRGTLVIVIDFRINGFDLINDIPGILLVVSGLGILARLDDPAGKDRFGQAHRLAIADAVLVALIVLLELAGTVIWPLNILDGACTVLGVLALADGVRSLAGARGADALATSWTTTLHLVLWLGAIPLAVLAIASAAAAGNGQNVYVETPLVIPVVLVALIPLVHLLMSLHRTKVGAAAFDDVTNPLPR